MKVSCHVAGFSLDLTLALTPCLTHDNPFAWWSIWKQVPVWTCLESFFEERDGQKDEEMKGRSLRRGHTFLMPAAIALLPEGGNESSIILSDFRIAWGHLHYPCAEDSGVTKQWSKQGPAVWDLSPIALGCNLVIYVCFTEEQRWEWELLRGQHGVSHHQLVRAGESSLHGPLVDTLQEGGVPGQVSYRIHLPRPAR